MDSRFGESVESATNRARCEAKRVAIEKAGVYLQSYSKSIDMQIEVDEIRMVASRLLKIQDEQSSVEIVENNLMKFTVTIQALVNDVDDEQLKSIMRDQTALEETKRKFNELQEEYNTLNRQMQEYVRDYDKANESEKIEIEKKAADNIEKFSAATFMEKGNDFYFEKNFEKSLSAYDTAIKLNSNFAEAYNNRGNAFTALEQYQNAIQDLNSALELDKNNAIIHNNLGGVYLLQRKFDNAIKEFSQALNINSQYAEAFYNRAIAYYAQGNFSKARDNIQTAMKLNPADSDFKMFYKKIEKKMNA